MDSAQDKLKDLIARHCETLRTNAGLLASFVAKMSEPDGSGEAARDARHIAHQIAGAGGSIGFMEISVLASDLERAIEPIVAINGVPSPAQREKIDALVAHLRRATAELRPEMSTLYGVNIGAAAAEARRRA